MLEIARVLRHVDLPVPVRSVVAGLVAYTTLDADQDGTPDVCASP